MTGGLAPNEPITLRADVRIEGGSGLEASDWTYEFDGASTASLQTLVAYADGTRSALELEALAGGSRDIFPLIDCMLQEGLARRGAPRPDNLTPAVFASVCRDLFPLWKARVFRKPLWTGLAAGDLPRTVFIGWVLESYHFIEGANLRLPYAVAHCYNERARTAFAHHYAEEYDHGEYYLRALKALGIDENEVLDAEPIMATTAVLNHMRRCARVDPLAYAVCSGFLESTGEDRESGREFLHRLDDHFSSAKSVAAPLLEHLQLDEDYGHNGLLEETCHFFGDLTHARASAALDAGFRLVETLEYWSDSIADLYSGDASDPLLPAETRRILARFTQASSAR